MAPATRLTERHRMSPAENAPGRLVSKGKSARFVLAQLPLTPLQG